MNSFVIVLVKACVALFAIYFNLTLACVAVEGVTAFAFLGKHMAFEGEHEAGERELAGVK